MRKFIVLPLLVLLAACTDDGAIMPVGPDGPQFAKKCPSPPCDKGDGGGGDDGYAQLRGRQGGTGVEPKPSKEEDEGTNCHIGDVLALEVVGGPVGVEFPNAGSHHEGPGQGYQPAYGVYHT